MKRSNASLVTLMALTSLACGGSPDDGAASDSDFEPPPTVMQPLDEQPGALNEDTDRSAPLHAELPEHDAQGQPLLYYGRVKVSERAQIGALSLFGFVHDRTPFFDDFDLVAATAKSPEASSETAHDVQWEYAIGTGVQWNILFRYPGIVDGVEMTPKLGAAHPQLEAMQRGQADGALDLALLAQAGFRMREIPVSTVQMCAAQGTGPASLHPLGLFSDVGDFFGSAADAIVDVLSDVADLCARALREGGAALTKTLELAARGVKEAVDLIRGLGNTGYCALTSTRPNTGRIEVYEHGQPYRRTSDDAPELLRYAMVRARGGVGGLLLTETRLGADGTYRFDDLCSDLSYSLAVEYDSKVAFLTRNGLIADSDELGSVGPNDRESVWRLETQSASFYAGAQIAYDFATAKLAMKPHPAKIMLGWPADSLVGSINGHHSVATCGALRLVPGFLYTIAGPIAGLLSAPLADGDIYGMSFRPDEETPIGVGIHEYSHYLECESIRQNGDLQGFLNLYSAGVLAHGNAAAEAAFDPLRNTAESIADFIAFSSVGYTNYFANNGSRGHRCDTDRCLEADERYLKPGNVPSAYREWVASRASIMYDWFDAPRRGMTSIDDDALSLPLSSLPKAIGNIGAHVTTTNLSTWYSRGISHPAEGLCAVYQSHGWDCAGVDDRGARLTAPTGFEGVASGPNSIRWSWSPISVLAEKYTVVVQGPNGPLDIGTVKEGQGFMLDQKLDSSAEGNQPVTAWVEARRTGTVPGRSRRITRCTLASPVGAPALSIEGGEVVVRWTNNGSSDYTISRASGAGAFVPAATVSSGAELVYHDRKAPPGATVRYRVDARNCNGIPTEGAEAKVTVPLDGALFVHEGAVDGDGSRAAPFGTLKEAIAVSAPNARIVVTEGVYAERNKVEHSMLIFGGYSPDFSERDTVKHPTVITPDGSTTASNWGASEFPRYLGRFLFEPHYSPDASLVLDGIIVEATRRGCDTNCTGMGIAYTRGDLVLRDVHFTSGGAARLAKNTRPTAIAITDKQCTVVDSDIDIGDWIDGSSTSALSCANALVTGTRIVSGLVNAGIDADYDLTLRNSIVLSDSSGKIGSNAAVTAGWLNVSNSVLYGAIAADARDDSSKIANSMLVGRTAIYGSGILINNVLMDKPGSSYPDLHPLPSCTATGEGFFPPCIDITQSHIVHNVFVGGVPLRFIRGDESWSTRTVSTNRLNDVNAWFRSAANQAKGNITVSNVAKIMNDLDTMHLVNVRLLPEGVAASAGADSTPYGIPFPVNDLFGRPHRLDLGVLPIGPFTQ